MLKKNLTSPFPSFIIEFSKSVIHPFGTGWRSELVFKSTVQGIEAFQVDAFYFLVVSQLVKYCKKEEYGYE